LPVTERHPSYELWADRWSKCRDFVDGEDAVKAAGVKYLPMLDGWTSPQYDAYRSRASFFGAAGRTVSGLVGAAFRVDPAADVQEKMKEWLGDIDLAGTAFSTFCQTLVSEVLTTGRYGVLVEFSEGVQRPYLVGYRTGAIINWYVERRNGVDVLMQVVVYEPRLQRKADGFGFDAIPRYRELVLLGDPGVYIVRLWEKDEEASKTANEEKWKVVETITPKQRGASLSYIPFQFFGPRDLGADVEKPPVLDLVNVNEKHYQKSADLDHGLHWVALPTPWVAGLSAPADGTAAPAFHIGSSAAWALPEGAQVGMLEVAGNGFGALGERLGQLEDHMVVLGAKLLGTDKRGVEAAEAVKMRMSADNATLAAIVATGSAGLTKVMTWARDWAGISGDVKIALNEQFFDESLDSTEIASVIAAWQHGAIGWAELVNALKRGGLVAPETDPEELRARAAADRPEPAADETGAGGRQASGTRSQQASE